MSDHRSRELGLDIAADPGRAAALDAFLDEPDFVEVERTPTKHEILFERKLHPTGAWRWCCTCTLAGPWETDAAKATASGDRHVRHNTTNKG